MGFWGFECKQPLVVQPTSQSILKQSKQELNETVLLVGMDPDALAEYDLYFFNQSGDAADYSNQVDRELKIKDIADSEGVQQLLSSSIDSLYYQLQLKHPVCLDCFGHVIKKLDVKISTSESERDLYLKQLLKIERKLDKLKGVSENEMDRELKLLEEEDQQLARELAELEQEEQSQQQELEKLSKARESLQAEDKTFWRDVNNYEKNLSGFQESLQQAEYLLKNLQWSFKRLKNTNILNEVFYISTLDEFGTISGFRMGKLPTTEVKQEEINAAIGQSVYLLAVLAHILKVLLLQTIIINLEFRSRATKR